MRVTILTVGSRGDVQPYVALARGLARAGHRVRIGAGPNCAAFVESCGVEFQPLRGDPAVDILWEDEHLPFEKKRARRVLASNLVRQWTGRASLYEGRMRLHIEDAWRASQGSDAILFSMATAFAGMAVAEKLRVPRVPAYLDPIVPSHAFPSPYLADLKLGPGGNFLAGRALRQVYWQMHRRAVNRARRDVLDLPPAPWWGPHRGLAVQRQPFLFGYSPSVLPKPADWAPWLHVTGYWFLDRQPEWAPPPALEDFLGSGPPPVYVGFGSVHISALGWSERQTPPKLTEMVLEALRQTGQRAILLTGGGPSRLSDSVFAAQDVPFEWLFARVTAAVHHAGNGTTAAVLRAGIPSVTVPFFDTQRFWAGRVYALGAGPEPILAKRLSETHLTEAIKTAVGNADLRRHAAAIAGRIRQEDGVGSAVEEFERYVSRAAGRR